jgi:hypothetical protein
MLLRDCELKCFRCCCDSCSLLWKVFKKVSRHLSHSQPPCSGMRPFGRRVVFLFCEKEEPVCSILCTNLNKVEQVRVMHALQGRGRDKVRGARERQARRVLDGEEAEGARNQACRAEDREERDRRRERAGPSGSSAQTARRAMNRPNGSLAPRWRSLSEEVTGPVAISLSNHYPTVHRINSKKNVNFLQPLKSKTIIHALLSFRADRSLSLASLCFHSRSKR